MTGIFLLFVMVLWVAIAILLSAAITRKLRSIQRVPAAVVIFAALLPLPLIDEIVGGRQFEQLCNRNSTIQVDLEKAVGKTVYLAETPDVDVDGTWLRIVMKQYRYVDATTGESILSYVELMARGGWLIRTLAISEGGTPLTFRGTCVPADRPGSVETFSPLGITYIEPPKASEGKNAIDQ